jgi:DNA-directed RNA polymerase specialized sigma24 family protein
VVYEPEALDLAAGPSRTVSQEQKLIVAEALALVSELDRQIFFLHALSDYDHKAIALALNITVTSSRKRLERTKKLLSDYLAPDGSALYRKDGNKSR